MAAKKKPASRSSSTSKSKKKKAPEKPQPIHREIIAFLLLLFAVFSVLGFFPVKAVLLKALRSFEKGLLGAGYYILPILLGWISVMLFKSAGRPVAARCLLTATLAILFGAFADVLIGTTPASFNSTTLKSLYEAGIQGPAGGVLTGLISMGLVSSVSPVGAVLLLLLCFAGCLMAPLRITPRSLILAIRNRPRPESEPEEEVDMAERIVNHISQTQQARAEARKKRREDFNVDLPVDDPPVPAEEPVLSKPESHELPKPKEEKKEPSGQFLFAQREENSQLTVDDLPELPEDVMPLPLITDLIEKNKMITPSDSTPEPVTEPGPLHIEEPEDSEEMPEFHVDDYRKVEEEPLEENMDEAEDNSDKSKEFSEEPDSFPEEKEVSSLPKVAGEEDMPYVFPPVDLLNPSTGGSIDATEEMRLNAERLSDTLRSFGVQPNIVNVTRGPTVTRYELQLNRGVKLSKITSLSEDIALSLGATGVRISAIPEKISVVGIEVPNRAVSTVYAREVIDSKEFASSKSKLSFAVGKDIGGNRIIGNIAKLPHLLIAGTTGSGKSVCMNSLIISLLYKASPDEVRLIMIDPKMVELGVYNGIPHLLIPVVTDPKKASGSLQWAVAEMMRRYSIMSESGARDIASYNRLIEGNEERKKLPQIVVVIDELADLMLVAAKEVEESICRVAQMGRAAGVHLVIATQRPSANVITGLMKANIPSRIAFAVASAMESRIILDTSGAEKLVGRGDMLYAPLGEGKAKRVQGCFITDEEVQRVAEFVKSSGKADYSQEIMDHIERKAAETGKSGGNTVSTEQEPDDDRDELLYDAVDVILDLGQASVSVLQRKLKLGYSRASRIVDQMEEMGIVGPHKGSKPRDILISKEKWEAVKSGLQSLNDPVPDEID